MGVSVTPNPSPIYLSPAFVKYKCADPAKWHEQLRYVLLAIPSS